MSELIEAQSNMIVKLSGVLAQITSVRNEESKENT